jgi:Na+-transporting NADH:ubiquinone oxidoreductase subunit NqrE
VETGATEKPDFRPMPLPRGEALMDIHRSSSAQCSWKTWLCLFPRHVHLSRSIETGQDRDRLGIAVIVVEALSVPLNAAIYNGLLRQGALAWAGLGDLDFSTSACSSQIAIIAAMVRRWRCWCTGTSGALPHTLGIFLPLSP